jgi:hypothetical protein
MDADAVAEVEAGLGVARIEKRIRFLYLSVLWLLY